MKAGFRNLRPKRRRSCRLCRNDLLGILKNRLRVAIIRYSKEERYPKGTFERMLWGVEGIGSHCKTVLVDRQAFFIAFLKSYLRERLCPV